MTFSPLLQLSSPKPATLACIRSQIRQAIAEGSLSHIHKLPFKIHLPRIQRCKTSQRRQYGYVCSFKRIATSDLGTCVSLCFCAFASVHLMWFVRLCLQALRKHSWRISWFVSSHQMFQQELRKSSLLSHRPSDESEHWLMRPQVFIRYGLQQQGAETVVAGAVLPS